jgi:hypothetical protein
MNDDLLTGGLVLAAFPLFGRFLADVEPFGPICTDMFRAYRDTMAR